MDKEITRTVPIKTNGVYAVSPIGTRASSVELECDSGAEYQRGVFDLSKPLVISPTVWQRRKKTGGGKGTVTVGGMGECD